MFHVALWEPEIPPNTGNVARLCAATGAVLHLIGRLGFRLDDRSLRRAGLDYWKAVDLRRHDTLAAFEAVNDGRRVFCFAPMRPRRTRSPSIRMVIVSCSAARRSACRRRSASVTPADPYIFRCRPRGASLNLATAVGIGLYEALRQVNGW